MVLRQIPLAIGPAPLMSLDSFVPGPGSANAAALTHLRALAGRPAAPVYLWGARGSGKTHLLHGLAAAWQAQGGQVAWFDAAAPLPWTVDEHVSLVVLDDAQALDERRQQSAFALFVDAAGGGVQWAAAGTLPPVDLPLRDDLRTRLAWGHVFGLQPLPEDEARAVLRREADRRGIFLADEVMGYLLTRFSRDLKHLMAMLDRLDEFALAEQRAITVPLLKRMVEAEGASL
jgi:DnaA family protein